MSPTSTVTVHFPPLPGPLPSNALAGLVKMPAGNEVTPVTLLPYTCVRARKEIDRYRRYSVTQAAKAAPDQWVKWERSGERRDERRSPAPAGSG